MSGLGIIIGLYFYIRLAIWVVRKLAGECESKQVKWGVRVAVALVFSLIPMWDVILGRIYLNYLCSTEAGVKVYQTVELPADYWDGLGRAKFFKENGDLDHSFLKNRFGETSSTKPYSSFFRIDETHRQLVDNSTQKILGEVVSFMYWGGWISRNSGLHNTAVDCKEFHGNQFWHGFYVRFFKSTTFSK